MGDLEEDDAEAPLVNGVKEATVAHWRFLPDATVRGEVPA
jgi:hypothetical protein